MKKGLLRKVAERALSEGGGGRGDINIILADDPLLQELNREYRKVDAPTDVLSFAYNEEEMLGEVVISLDACLRQAKEKGHSWIKELMILVAHGVLHLLGWEDETEEGWRKMCELQERIVEEVERSVNSDAEKEP